MVEIKAADLEVRCFFTWRMKGHNRFYGSVWKTPMGLEGSGAFRRPGSIVRVLRTERWVRPTERAGSEGSFICRCLGQRKPYNRPGGRGNASPFGGWRHHLVRWEACHLILSRLRLLANQVPLPPLRGGTMDA